MWILIINLRIIQIFITLTLIVRIIRITKIILNRFLKATNWTLTFLIIIYFVKRILFWLWEIWVIIMILWVWIVILMVENLGFFVNLLSESVGLLIRFKSIRYFKVMLSLLIFVCEITVYEAWIIWLIIRHV